MIYFRPLVSKFCPPCSAKIHRGFHRYWWQVETLCDIWPYMGVFSVREDIGICHWPRRWVDGAQSKCKCLLCFRISCEIVGWLIILFFPENLLGDWLFPNLNCWESYTTRVVGEEKIGSWGGEQTKCEVHECQLTKNIFFHSDLLHLCLNKNVR